MVKMMKVMIPEVEDTCSKRDQNSSSCCSWILISDKIVAHISVPDQQSEMISLKYFIVTWSRPS